MDPNDTIKFIFDNVLVEIMINSIKRICVQ